jgi:hypothetical protein
MSKPKFTKEVVEEIIINFLKRNGSIKNFSDLDIFKKDPSSVCAAFFRMEKDGIIVKENNFYSIAEV